MVSPSPLAIDPGRFGSGQAVRRLEDDALLAGTGQFTDAVCQLLSSKRLLGDRLQVVSPVGARATEPGGQMDGKRRRLK